MQLYTSYTQITLQQHTEHYILTTLPTSRSGAVVWCSQMLAVFWPATWTEEPWRRSCDTLSLSFDWTARINSGTFSWASAFVWSSCSWVSSAAVPVEFNPGSKTSTQKLTLNSAYKYSRLHPEGQISMPLRLTGLKTSQLFTAPTLPYHYIHNMHSRKSGKSVYQTRKTRTQTVNSIPSRDSLDVLLGRCCVC